MSIDIANGFCGGDGVILQMKPIPGAYDTCFNVEWISCFAHEKERVFALAEVLEITNIKYYARGKWRNNQPYLRAFNLFSCLFGGHYISPLLRAGNKKLQKPCNVLLDLITVYKANNNIGSQFSGGKIETGQDVVSAPSIPIYIQQLFYQLLYHFQHNQEGKYLIKSEYELLPQPLQNELLARASNDSNDAEKSKMATIPSLRLSALMKSLCCNEEIILMSQHIWIIDEPTVKQLREAKNIKRIYSETQYFKLSSSESVSFEIGLTVNSGRTDWCSLKVVIKETPTAVDGRISFIIDELGACLNNLILDTVRKGGLASKWVFKHSLLQNRPNVDILTLRAAVYLTPST